MDLGTWLNNHWHELAAALGIGTGSGIIGGRWVDREQNKRLTKLEEMVKYHNDQIIRSEGANSVIHAKLDALDRRFERIEEMLIQVIRDEHSNKSN